MEERMPGVLRRNSGRSGSWCCCALGVPLWLLLAGAAVAADPVPASIAADAGLAARVAALEQRLASMEDEAPQTQGRVSVNGFMSAGVAQVLDDRYRYDVDTVGPEASFRPDSMLGVQLDMTVNDQVRAITQLVGRGSEDFDARMEWAFLSLGAPADRCLPRLHAVVLGGRQLGMDAGRRQLDARTAVGRRHLRLHLRRW
jgi:hypothetical protein